MQEVPSGVGDPALQALDTCFGLVPVVGKFHLAAHLALRLSKRLLMPFEAVERGDIVTIAQGCKARNADIDPDPLTQCRMHRRYNRLLGLKTDPGVASSQAQGAVFDRARDLAAFTESAPAQPRG